jgi:hypothetical protein
LNYKEANVDLLEKLIVFELAKKLPAFYGT